MALVPIYQSLEETVEPAHTGLIVIDVQNDFRVPSYDPMIARLQKLIAAARQCGVFVAYVQNTVLPGLSNSAAEIARRRKLGLAVDVTLAGSQGEKIVADICPQDGEPIVRKHRLNAFAGTNLEMLLQNRGVETVIITGVATHGCVTGTSYAAQAFNHYVVVVEDCVDSWKPDLHEAALHVLRNTMNYVTSAETVMQIWRAAAMQRSHSHAASSFGAVS